MEKTLLQKALEIEVNSHTKFHEYTDEHLELVLAWLKGEIKTKQFYRAAGISGGSEAAFAIGVIRWALKNNREVK